RTRPGDRPWLHRGYGRNGSRRSYAGRRHDGRAERAGGAMIRVLIVEDERPLLRALAMNLTAPGYVVTEAETGSRALTALADHQHDAVVLDLGLPDMPGIDVIRAV